MQAHNRIQALKTSESLPQPPQALPTHEPYSHIIHVDASFIGKSKPMGLGDRKWLETIQEHGF